MKTKLLWKSLPKNLDPHGFTFTLGKWHKHNGKLEMCESGFHACENAVDAIGYVACEKLALVEVKGKHLKQDNKQCWQEMKLVKVWNWNKKDSVSLAIFAAELVIDIYEKEYPKDKRPRKAIEAAKRVLKNDNAKTRGGILQRLF